MGIKVKVQLYNITSKTAGKGLIPDRLFPVRVFLYSGCWAIVLLLGYRENTNQAMFNFYRFVTPYNEIMNSQ